MSCCEIALGHTGAAGYHQLMENRREARDRKGTSARSSQLKRFASRSRPSRARPNQYRAVAFMRLEDAKKLPNSARSSGAVYLGGYAIECMLKAQLLCKHVFLQTHAQSEVGLTDNQRGLWRMAYMLHDIDSLLKELPSVARMLEANGIELDSLRYHWSPHTRYSTIAITADAASEFVRMADTITKHIDGMS